MKYLLKYSLPAILLALTTTTCTKTQNALLSNLPNGLYSIITTEKGPIIIELYYDKTPLTVTNFVGLASGAFSQTIDRKGNYYDGLTFHRVVDDFVVQGGDPVGDGTGGPGYSFADEIDSSLVFDSQGIVAMANSGPNTNGSQFFISLKSTDWLNGKYAIFGTVVKNMNIVTTIEQDDIIQSISIEAKGRKAQKFLSGVSWDSFKELQKNLQNQIDEQAKKKRIAIEERIIKEKPALQKSTEGIYYTIEKEGSGKFANQGDTVSVHYQLRIYGKDHIVDSSVERNTPLDVTIGTGQVIQGWEIILQYMAEGEKRRVIIPPELGYGATEVGGGMIPPNSFLDFKIEILNITKNN